MVTAEALRLTSQGAQTELHRLCLLTEGAADALAAAEQRAAAAEAKAKRASTRLAQLRTAPADLALAARALLDRLDTITTAQFAAGGENAERETLRTLLEAIEGDKCQVTR